MKLNELLDKALPFDVKINDEVYFYVEFTVGDRKITFTGENEAADINYDDGEWSVSFAELKNGRQSYDKTGSGNEIQVFATLKSIFQQFIKDRDPEVITFSADKKDGNRAKLYARMFKKNLPSGWELQSEPGADYEPVYFMMVKEDVRDDWLSIDTIKQIWNDANEKVFDSQLDMPKISLEDDLNYLAKRYGPDAMEEAKNGDMLGYCDKEGSKIILRFSKKIKNARELLEVVVHEMVHQAEAMRLTWLKMLRDPHGEEFLAWEDRVKKYHNLSLRQIIGQ